MGISGYVAPLEDASGRSGRSKTQADTPLVLGLAGSYNGYFKYELQLVCAQTELQLNKMQAQLDALRRRRHPFARKKSEPLHGSLVAAHAALWLSALESVGVNTCTHPRFGGLQLSTPQEHVPCCDMHW